MSWCARAWRWVESPAGWWPGSVPECRGDNAGHCIIPLQPPSCGRSGPCGWQPWSPELVRRRMPSLWRARFPRLVTGDLGQPDRWAAACPGRQKLRDGPDLGPGMRWVLRPGSGKHGPSRWRRPPPAGCGAVGPPRSVAVTSAARAEWRRRGLLRRTWPRTRPHPRCARGPRWLIPRATSG